MPAAGTRDRRSAAELLGARAAPEEKLPLLLESQRWPVERRRRWRDERLTRLIDAARRTPFWAERVATGAALEDVPPLDRAVLRDEMARMRPAGERLVVTSRTSGSTGRPVTVEHGAAAIGFAAAVRLRQLTWFGLPPRALPQANVLNTLGGDEPLLRRVRDDPPQFLMSPFALDRAAIRAAHAEMVAAGGVALLGCNSAIFEQWAELYSRSGADARELGARLCIIGSEMTTPSQRRTIEDVFGCPTADMYGSHEAPMIATECARGSLHVNEEVVHLEVLRPDGSPAPPGELGEVVVTLLHNVELPLLRYRLGDAAAFAEGACECGLTLRRLDLRVGHLEEMAMRTDGSMVHPRFIRTALEDGYTDRIRAFHTLQLGPARFVIYLDLAAPLPPGAGESLERSFEQVMHGPVSVELVPDAERATAPLPGGKRRSFTRSIEPRTGGGTRS
jgi:phenylacetate-CoA ligase